MAGFYKDNKNTLNILSEFLSGNINDIIEYYRRKESTVSTFLSYIQQQKKMQPIEDTIIRQYYKLLEKKASDSTLVIILESYSTLEQIFRLLPKIYYSPLVNNTTFLRILDILGNIINLHVVDKDIIVQALNLIFANTEQHADKEIYIFSKFQIILSAHPCYLYIYETTSLKNIEHERRQIEERRQERERLKLYIYETTGLKNERQQEETRRPHLNILGDQMPNAECICIAYRLSQISSDSEDYDYGSDEIPELV